MASSPFVTLPPVTNEPIKTYAPQSPERHALQDAIASIRATPREVEARIAGQVVEGSGPAFDVRAPHSRALLLATGHQSGEPEVRKAISSALTAGHDWRRMGFEERAAIFLKAADLLSGPWRARLNAATMLGQSKSVHQAEIDSACELIDFWRFNVTFARRMWEEQPLSSPGVWNRLDLRPLEGFVYAVTPFNFTSIAGNLPTAPALMGNTVVWKPSMTQQLSASLIMELLEEAGLPPGVINMVTGEGPVVSDVVMSDRRLAGIHFTGSTATFRHLWQTAANHLEHYATFPRLVGETGGKNFLVAHPTADPAAVVAALLRGSFEYQGQKCSATSRAYLPLTMWRQIKEELIDGASALAMGDPTEFSTFMGAVIDGRSWKKLSGAIRDAQADEGLTIVGGGVCDDREGWFVSPTIIETTDPHHDLMTRELFGPVLTIYPYERITWDKLLTLVDTTSPSGLTGSIFAKDRTAITEAVTHLTHAAGNLYINDKSTGAVVGQQPFGGARASGTNDKAGSPINLLRWVSPRVIKEVFVSPTAITYPHQQMR